MKILTQPYVKFVLACRVKIWPFMKTGTIALVALQNNNSRNFELSFVIN